MNEKLKGVFAPITTPFTSEGKVDYAALQHNMAFYASSGIQSYLALDSNGENGNKGKEMK